MPRNSVVRVYNSYTNFTNPHFQSPFAQTLAGWKPSKKRGKRKPVKKAQRR